MISPVEETTKSVDALSSDRVCSKYSNNKKIANSENAATAYNNFLRPVFPICENTSCN